MNGERTSAVEAEPVGTPRRRRWVLALGVSLLLLAVAPAANAIPTPHMATGHWAGFFRSVDNPDFRGALTLDVASQRGRRFTGEIRGFIIDGGVPVQGTMSASGQVSITGRSPQVRNLQIQGSSPFAESQAGEFEPCILVGRFGIILADGSNHRGNVVAVHQVPDADAPSFAGGWSGTSSNRASVNGTLSQADLGTMTGRLGWGNPPDGERDFGVVGQAFGDASGGGVMVVGSAGDALIAMLLTGTPTRTGAGVLAGDYVMFKEVDPAGRTNVERGSINLAAVIP